MSLMRRTLFLALFGLFLVQIVPAPAAAYTLVPVPLTIEVTERGAGPTIPDAIDNTLASIASHYPNHVLVSYTWGHGLCSPLPFGDGELCSVEVTAKLRRKFFPIVP